MKKWMKEAINDANPWTSLVQNCWWWWILFKCQETLRTTNITNILFTVYKIYKKKKKHAS